jgi:hypothetical protein
LVSVPVGNGTPKVVRRDAWLEPQPQLGIFSCGYGVPHLRFANSARGGFMCARVFIAGMDLHGKMVLRENKLYEKRNARLATHAIAGPLRRKFRPSLANRAASQRTGGPDALSAG